MEEAVIKMSACTGCEICMDECPTDVFAMEADNKAHVIAPQECIDCHLCEEDCPTEAIHLVAA